MKCLCGQSIAAHRRYVGTGYLCRQSRACAGKGSTCTEATVGCSRADCSVPRAPGHPRRQRWLQRQAARGAITPSSAVMLSVTPTPIRCRGSRRLLPGHCDPPGPQVCAQRLHPRVGLPHHPHCLQVLLQDQSYWSSTYIHTYMYMSCTCRYDTDGVGDHGGYRHAAPWALSSPLY